MKKIAFVFVLFLLSSAFVFAQEEDFSDETVLEAANPVAAKGGLAVIPDPCRPKPMDKEKAEKAAEKDENDETVEKYQSTIKYGVATEISELITTLIDNDDPRFADDIYDLFQVTKSTDVKEKIINYFKKMEDSCVADFACEVLNDPFESKNSLVSACLQYISEIGCKNAIPPVITMIENEDEKYFNEALLALGGIGGTEEALFLVEYLDRDDLSDAQRQSLMRTLGKMQAIETWERLCEIAQNEDENLFVRMYASEAIGNMKKLESVPILVELFEESDPNLRVYVLKGLVNFPDTVEAINVIIEAIRDDHVKVRTEAVEDVKKLDIKESVPYLIYRAKNDSEDSVKKKCIEALAALNTKEGNEYLISVIEDKKAGDSSKAKVVEELLKAGYTGKKEILVLAEASVKDDKKTNLRYAIGKALVKYIDDSFDEICLKFLESKDSTTISLGLDMYQNKKWSSVKPKVEELAKDKKESAIKRRAIRLVGEQEEEEEEASK